MHLRTHTRVCSCLSELLPGSSQEKQIPAPRQYQSGVRVERGVRATRGNKLPANLTHRISPAARSQKNFHQNYMGKSHHPINRINPLNPIQPHTESAPCYLDYSTGAPLTLSGFLFFTKISQTAGLKHTLGNVGQIQSVSSPPTSTAY